MSDFYWFGVKHSVTFTRAIIDIFTHELLFTELGKCRNLCTLAYNISFGQHQLCQLRIIYMLLSSAFPYLAHNYTFYPGQQMHQKDLPICRGLSFSLPVCQYGMMQPDRAVLSIIRVHLESERRLFETRTNQHFQALYSVV